MSSGCTRSTATRSHHAGTSLCSTLSRKINLDTFASVADEVPNGDVNIYGWSSDGSGGSTKLPCAKAKVRGDSPLVLYEAPKAPDVALKDGARI